MLDEDGSIGKYSYVSYRLKEKNSLTTRRNIRRIGTDKVHIID